MEHLGSIFLLIVGEEKKKNFVCKNKLNSTKHISVLHTTAIAIFFIEIIVAQAKYAKLYAPTFWMICIRNLVSYAI